MKNYNIFVWLAALLAVCPLSVNATDVTADEWVSQVAPASNAVSIDRIWATASSRPDLARNLFLALSAKTNPKAKHASLVGLAIYGTSLDAATVETLATSLKALIADGGTQKQIEWLRLIYRARALKEASSKAKLVDALRNDRSPILYKYLVYWGDSWIGDELYSLCSNSALPDETRFHSWLNLMEMHDERAIQLLDVAAFYSIVNNRMEVGFSQFLSDITNHPDIKALPTDQAIAALKGAPAKFIPKVQPAITGTVDWSKKLP